MLQVESVDSVKRLCTRLAGRGRLIMTGLSARSRATIEKLHLVLSFSKALSTVAEAESS